MPQIQKCITWYSSPYWCSVPNIRKLASVVPEKKCDRNYLVSKFAYVHNIQSCVKQEVDMPHIQNCVTRYSSPYWCSVPNIRKLACVVPEKNVPEIFCDADDDVKRQKWSLYVASAKAGRRHKNIEHGICGLTLMVLLAFLRSFRSFSLSSIAFLCAPIASSNEDFNFSTLVSCSNKKVFVI